MVNQNKWVSEVLKDFIESLTNHKYFAIGSVALIAYTSKTGYSRKIKDVDIICEQNNFSYVVQKLLSKGYKQYSFIDKKFPLFNKLNKLAKTKYYRFEKNGKNLEIMTTDFGNVKEHLSIEIYPNIRFTIPSELISSAYIGGVKIQALIPEALYCVYNFGLKTWGMIVKDKIERRKTDLKALSKVVDTKKLNLVAKSFYLSIGKITIKIPKFLLI